AGVVTAAESSRSLGSLPDWLRPMAELASRIEPAGRSRVLSPPHGGGPSPVLLFCAEGSDGPDLLIIERSHDMRSHAGQPAFPGGSLDPEDGGPEDAALREAWEETGLDPAGVEVFATL